MNSGGDSCHKRILDKNECKAQIIVNYPFTIMKSKLLSIKETFFLFTPRNKTNRENFQTQKNYLYILTKICGKFSSTTLNIYEIFENVSLCQLKATLAVEMKCG